MGTSKQMVKASPNLENGINNGGDYIGFNEEMITGLMIKTLKQYDLHKRLDIQSTESKNENRKYYLFKRPSKKKGYIYQMNLIDPENGVRLPTKYSTGKSKKEEAEQWAEQNYKSCLAKYNGKAELTLLDTYYSKESPYFKYEEYEGRKLSPDTLKDRQNFMKRYITPFLQSQKVRFLSQITPLIIRELKNFLISKNNLTQQTINRNLNSLKRALIVFYDNGKISYDFRDVDFNVKSAKKAVRKRNVYPFSVLKGVFSKQWKTPLYKILNMFIYFTGMRNSEIKRIQMNDIIPINDVYFLDVKGTKTANAKRTVPIHPTLYKELKNYVKANKIKDDTAIFTGICYDTFCRARWEMGSLLGYTKDQLYDKNICFYSGRHSCKKIFKVGNEEGIGNVGLHIQEMIFGRSHSKKVLKEEGINEYEYGNIDADVLGNTQLSKKGLEVFKIIDHFYF